MKIRRNILLLNFLLFFWNCSSEQKTIGKEIYAHVYDVGFINDPDTLVRLLTAAFPGDEYRQAESIYLWIKLNIRYDFAKFAEFSSSPNNTDGIQIKNVLASSMGVCEDFSTLAQQMFEKAGIKCFIIKGYAKQGTDQFFQNVDNFRHAWNAILLNGKWSLIDCTWASLSKAYGDSSDYFFMTALEELIYSHYPDEEKWTLLPQSPSFEAFKKFPLITPLFFSIAHQPVPEHGYLYTKNGMIEIPALLNIDSTIEFSYEDTSSGEKGSLLPKLSDNAQKKKVYQIFLPAKGTYLLKIQKKTRMADINPDLFKLKLLICFGVTWN